MWCFLQLRISLLLPFMNSFASKLWAVVRAVARAAISEQMVFSLSCAITIILSWPFPYLHFGLNYVGSCDLEGSCHQTVKCELVWLVRPLGVGSSDLMGSIERWQSAFSTPAVWNGANRILLPVGRESWHEKESSRNGWRVCRPSRSCHSSSHHMTSTPLREFSDLLKRTPQTVCKIFLKDLSFLESSFGTSVSKWVFKYGHICRTN